MHSVSKHPSPPTVLFRQCLFMLLTGCLAFFHAQTAYAELVINEVDADQEGVDSAEFIELYNSGPTTIDLSGYQLVLFNGSNDEAYQVFSLIGSIAAGDYFVLCSTSGTVANCNMSVSPATDLLQNGADAVALYDSPISGSAVTTTNLVDALVYDTDDGDDAGLLVLLNPGQPQVNENGPGNKAYDSNQRIPNGSGGQRNTSTYTQALPTPGASNNICGDGVVQSDEGCDDGGTQVGDGCSDTCRIENGWLCSGEPSLCSMQPSNICGDGVVLGAEECDDGDTLVGDGCSDTCRIENGWLCSGEPSLCSMETKTFYWPLFLPAVQNNEVL